MHVWGWLMLQIKICINVLVSKRIFSCLSKVLLEWKKKINRLLLQMYLRWISVSFSRTLQGQWASSNSSLYVNLQERTTGLIKVCTNQNCGLFFQILLCGPWSAPIMPQCSISSTRGSDRSLFEVEYENGSTAGRMMLHKRLPEQTNTVTELSWCLDWLLKCLIKVKQ